MNTTLESNKDVGVFGKAVNIDYVKNPENDVAFAIDESQLDQYLASGYIRLTQAEAHELMSKQ